MSGGATFHIPVCCKCTETEENPTTKCYWCHDYYVQCSMYLIARHSDHSGFQIIKLKFTWTCIKYQLVPSILSSPKIKSTTVTTHKCYVFWTWISLCYVQDHTLTSTEPSLSIFAVLRVFLSIKVPQHIHFSIERCSDIQIIKYHFWCADRYKIRVTGEWVIEVLGCRAENPVQYSSLSFRTSRWWYNKSDLSMVNSAVCGRWSARQFSVTWKESALI